jgi:hypothetical protein
MFVSEHGQRVLESLGDCLALGRHPRWSGSMFVISALMIS